MTEVVFGMGKSGEGVGQLRKVGALVVAGVGEGVGKFSPRGLEFPREDGEDDFVPTQRERDGCHFQGKGLSEAVEKGEGEGNLGL